VRRVAVFIVVALGCARAPSATVTPAPAEPLAPASAPALAATVPNRAPQPEPEPEGMVWIPGGEFSMGAADATEDGAGMTDALADARPIHRVYVDGFWMDRTVVTNAQFARFTKETGYVTVAERRPRAEDFPGAPQENLVAGSVVFTPPARAVPLDTQLRWWSYVVGASWRHPAGPGSDLRGRWSFPVVHVAWEDAVAYARWAGKRLPTEAEFEFAARGGLAGKRYAWGDQLRPGGQFMANTFQGHFPDRDTGEDGTVGLTRVAGFPANGYGLYDITGNVWEWCADWYRRDAYEADARLGVARNPGGPADSFDPAEPGVAKRVMRGGSFLCSSQYCARYLVAGRGKGEPSTGTNHVGFRCVRSR
jgi:formylglycine-generating enzyme required for sulfatase activity